MASKVPEFAVAAGSVASVMLDRNTTDSVIFAVVVPKGWNSHLDFLYDAELLAPIASAAPTVFMGLRIREVDVLSSWMVSSPHRKAILYIRSRAPQLFSVRLTFDLLDPDWRRMLTQLHHNAGLGTDVWLYLYPSQNDLDRAIAALGEANIQLFSSYGLELGTCDCSVLSRVERVGAALSPEEIAVSPIGQERAVDFFRQEFASVVTIDPQHGGALPGEVGPGAMVVIDLGQPEGSDEWVEAGLRTLIDLRFQRVTSLEHRWPTAPGWRYILFPQHLVIFHQPVGDENFDNVRMLYAGPLLHPQSWADKARAGLGVMVANLGIRTIPGVGTADDAELDEKIGMVSERVQGALAFSEAVGAAIPGFVDDKGHLRTAIEAAERLKSFHDDERAPR